MLDVEKEHPVYFSNCVILNKEFDSIDENDTYMESKIADRRDEDAET